MIDIIRLECLKKLQYTKKDSKAVEILIVGFRGQCTYPLGMKKLPIRVGDKEKSRIIKTNFFVVDILMAYTAILGRSTLNAIKAVVAPNLLLI